MLCMLCMHFLMPIFFLEREPPEPLIALIALAVAEISRLVSSELFLRISTVEETRKMTHLTELS